MTKLLRALFTVFVITCPALAYADASASVGALSPGGTVGVGIPVTFSMITSGFNTPKYSVADSFPGGVTTVNMGAQGDFSWTPNKDDIGTHTISISVSDSDGHSATAATTIVVVVPSVTVTSASPSNTIRFGTPVTFTINASGFAIPTYTVADAYMNSSVTTYNTKESGSFVWTPLSQDVGIHKLIVTAKDYRNTATTSATITVIGLPSVTIMNLPTGNKVAAGSSVTFDASTTGLISPKFILQDTFYSGTSSPLTIDSAGHVSWDPKTSDIGAHFVTVSASDTQNIASTQFNFTVAANSQSTQNLPQQPVSTPTTTASVQKIVLTRDLAVGSRGTEVSALQQKLAQLGFLKSEPTGYFGGMTKLAVQAFQKSVHLSPVGRVGPATRAALMAL